MRTMMLAGFGLALAMPAAANAQEDYGAAYPAPGQVMPGQPIVGRAPATPPRPLQPGADRWGSRVDGRWWGGANAPGGWAAYREPYQGYALPPYWSGSRFGIADWASYDLTPPPAGYRWSRYYDDAVLIDRNGSVSDSVSGIDWTGDRPQDRGDAYRPDDRVYAGPGDRSHGRYDPRYGERGPRRGSDVPPPAQDHADGQDYAGDYGAPYDAPYGAPYYGGGEGDALPPPPPHHLPPSSRYVTPDGGTIVTTSVGGGGYYGGGSTIVTVRTAPVQTTTTTTTTTYVDRVRTYARRGAVRRGSGSKIIRR